MPPGDLTIPESFLREVWKKQTFTSTHLVTSAGLPVQILSPGNQNNDAGPDFLNARIRIGSIMYRGDVELHVNADEWHAHNHELDAHYNRVILHVVLHGGNDVRPARTATARPIPVLILHPYLDEKLHASWSATFVDEHAARKTALACAGKNNDVPISLIFAWLDRLAAQRLELKLRRFEERLKELVDERRDTLREPYPRYYGNVDEIPPLREEYHRRDFADPALWEQLLYEGIMEALGYSKNSSAFLQLARSMRLSVLREYHFDSFPHRLALLFGAAGLLPSTRMIEEKESRLYLRPLRRIWKEFRPSFTGTLLNEADWIFFRLRPANFPTARLASMAFFLPQLFSRESFRELIRLFKRDGMFDQDRLEELQGRFLFEPNDFWRSHYHFRKSAGRHGVSLGEQRIDDIIVNAIIPVVLLYARIFNDSVVRETARALLSRVPPSEDNVMTDSIQRQLLRKKGVLDSALRQQGAIHLFKLFCTIPRCAECEIGRSLGMG